MFLYHGTSETTARQVLREGLKPRAYTGVDNWKHTVSSNKKFIARMADVNRGWALFCSKSCKASEQENRTHQYKNILRRSDKDFEFGHPMESGYFGHGQE